MTHQHTIWGSLSATSQPNYIIIPCLIVPVQLRRGRAFVWLLECGALGIFQRKGSFLEDGAKEQSRGWDHGCWCPLLFLHLYHSHSIFLGLSSLSLGLCICLWISQFWTIPSLFCVRLLCIGLTNRSPEKQFTPSPFPEPSSGRFCCLADRAGLFDVKCTGFGSSMIRPALKRDRSVRGLPVASDSELGGSYSAPR